MIITVCHPGLRRPHPLQPGGGLLHHLVRHHQHRHVGLHPGYHHAAGDQAGRGDWQV